MTSLNTSSLECNKQIKINFDGGELSSDAGLFLIKEFAEKTGFIRLIKKHLRTNDTAVRLHKDDSNLMQLIDQILAAYFEDDCADELTTDPVFTAILEKDSLASQPTISRFWNRMDESTLSQFSEILSQMRKIIYSIQTPEHMLFDLDSTLLDTYGHQEGEEYNFHYQSHGYHPLLCYDGITGDLLKAELRDGTQYCSKGSDAFMSPLLQEFRANYISLFCANFFCLSKLKFASDADEALYRATLNNQIDYAVVYGEFFYQAGSWSHPRRVVYKIEKPYGQMVHLHTFIVTTMKMEPYQIIQFYCGRGKMENFIKESKNGFDFTSVSSHSKIVNANRLQVHALTYNLFNWFKRLVLPARMRKQQIDTIRLKLLKIAAKAVHSARYITFKLCSSCPYKKEFYETLSKIQQLQVQLE